MSKSYMKKIFSIVMIVAMALGLTACGGGSDGGGQSGAKTPDGGTRELQLGHIDPSTDTDAYQIFALSFKDKVEKLSGGKLSVKVYGDAQLGGEIEMFEAMTIGDLDMAIITNNYYPNFIKDFMVFDLPFIFADYDQEHQVVDDPAILSKLQEKTLEKGVRLLTYADSGFRYIVNNRNPIATVEDLKGLKIRLPETTLYVKTFQALDANPTTMAFSEAYTAVQQGTVDGLEITASAIYSGGFYQVCKYLSKTRHFCSPITLNMSESVWKTLSSEEQEIIMKAAQEARDESRKKVIDNEQMMFAEMEKAGCKLNDIKDVKEFRDKTAPVIEYVRGEAGNEILDMVLKKVGQ